MKKIIFLLILLLFPFSIKGLEITDYRIDITVLENGDINILEDFDMEGVYNGYKRIVKYKDNYQGYYGAFLLGDFDSNLYNGTKVVLNEVRGINFNLDIPSSSVKINGDLFNKVNKAQKGDYGTYVILNKQDYFAYLIYNPNKMNKDFYLDYTISDMVVNHKDISELSMYIFSPLTENINNLQIYIHIPNNLNLLKGWTHRNENSNVEVIDNTTIKLTYEYLKKNETVDFRIIFDLSSVISDKKTDRYALESVYEIEKEIKENLENPYEEQYKKKQDLAYQAVINAESSLKMEALNYALEKVNELDENDKLQTDLYLKLMNLVSKIEKYDSLYKTLYTSIVLFWIFGLIIIIYKKLLKQEKNNFKLDLNLHPNHLSYLLKPKIKLDDFIFSVLYLIEQKVILVEKKRNIYLIKNKDATNDVDEKILKFLFYKKDKINLFRLKEYAFKDYEHYINQYSNWFNSIHSTLEEEKYYENIFNFKIFGIIYSTIGLILGIIFRNSNSYISLYLLIVLSILSLIFFILFYKRTYKGKKTLNGVRKIKKYLKNFSKHKSLPSVDKWGIYLIYSYSFNCFDNLSKEMIEKYKLLKTKYESNYIKDKLYIYKNIRIEIKKTIKNSYIAKRHMNK